MLGINKKKLLGNNKGFSLPEIVVVLLVGGIILVIALPQLITSRRLMKFSSIQRQIASSLTEARQEAMSQRRAVTFRYNNSTKQIIVYGGSFGTLGNAQNKTTDLAGFGVPAAEIRYGRPGGVPTAALSDTTNLTTLAGSVIEVTFQPDGSVLDASGNPQNKALFFFNNIYRKDTAFAVSVLGAGGRVKVWRYKQGVNAYVE